MEEIKSGKVPIKRVYHATPLRYLESVKRRGLLARPNKHHFYSGTVGVTRNLEDLQDFMEEAYEMVRYPGYGRKPVRRWAVFEVAATGLSFKGHPDDPELESTSDIPPDRLKLIGVFDIKEKEWT